VSATTQAIRTYPDSLDAWTRHAFALARTDRIAEGIEAAERALALGADGEVVELLDHLRATLPRVLPAA
jgi:hypothetical protein